FVNKMDRLGANFFSVVEKMRERLGANAIPIQIPIGAESGFRGIVDLVTMQASVYKGDDGREFDVVDIPPDMLDLAAEWREKLIEEASMLDDSVMESYLAGEKVNPDQIKEGLRLGTLAGKIIPVTCGSAYK